MRWRLHPVHRSKSNDEILQNCFARDVDELDRCVSRLARQHFETVAIEEEIELTSSSILLSQNAQLVLRIPLLLADLAYEWVSQAPGGLSSYVLGVLPRSRQPGSHSLWVFMVGPCSMKEFHEHLWNFGRHGAVRRDVNSALALTSTVVGAGGCGKVLLANKWDATGEYVDTNLAVKELLPKGKPVECTLRTEIEFLAAAQGHPNVAILQGVFHQIDRDSENVFKAPGSPEEVMTQDKEVGRDRWLIALKLYTGGDLFERVQRFGPLKEAETVEVMLGLLSALAYVHHLGIVHRDVKCENILLDGNRAILSDFGISCFLSNPESMGKRVGSPGYASPEMLKGESYNEKIDIFATGVALYFALSCSLPFADSSVARVLARTVRCNIHWRQEKFQHFSGGLVKLCKTLLSKDPKDRPSAQTAFAAMWALLRPKERQVETVLQSLHAIPSSSTSATSGRGRGFIQGSSTLVEVPSDCPRSASPWRKLMETRRLRRNSKESRPDITDDPADDNSLNTFLTCKGGAAESDAQATHVGSPATPCAPSPVKPKPTGFIRRNLKDFFHSIRVRGTKVSPLQAEDPGSGVRKGAFDAVVPKVVEQPRPPPESAMQSLDYDAETLLGS